MKKRTVIEGELCDVCGRIAKSEHMYIGGYNDWGYVSPKELTIKMDGGPFYNIVDNSHRPGGGRRAREYRTVCPVCASELYKVFQSWLDKCWRDGEKDRTERMLDFERRFAKKRNDRCLGRYIMRPGRGTTIRVTCSVHRVGDHRPWTDMWSADWGRVTDAARRISSANGRSTVGHAASSIRYPMSWGDRYDRLYPQVYHGLQLCVDTLSLLRSFPHVP